MKYKTKCTEVSSSEESMSESSSEPSDVSLVEDSSDYTESDMESEGELEE